MNKIDIINRGNAIPDRYTQYPGGLTPSEIYGGSWRSIFDDEGVFFRTAGGNALPFGAGIQLDELREHRHNFLYSSHSSGEGDSRYGGTNNRSRRKTTELTGGNETRPINRTIRVWERI